MEEWVSDESLMLKVIHPDDRERVLAEHRRTQGDRGVLLHGVPDDRARRDCALVPRRGRGDPRRVGHAEVPLRLSPRHHGAQGAGGRLRRSEEELRRQRRHLESLLEISPTAIVTLDLEGTVTSWNLAAGELFGYMRDEAVGRNLEDLITNSDDLRAEAVDYYAELVGRDASTP